MLSLHDYQKAARDFLLTRLYKESGAGLWLDPGMGKTITTLNTVELLRFDGLRKVVLIAPARVLLTSWPNEIKKWGLNFTFGTLAGTEAERRKVMESNPDILFISAEACGVTPRVRKSDGLMTPPNIVEWLVKNRFKADLLVVDESTKFKNWSAKRTKRVRRLILNIPKRITLTGTPVPNTMADIFPQQFLLDQGKTLGTAITRFREMFCIQGGHENREWIFNDARRKDLEDMVAPWYLRQSALDHLDMPKLVHNDIKVDLPPAAKKVYQQMQREMYAEIDGGQSLIAMTGGSRYNLCRQIASGSAYDENGTPISVHTAKLDALEDLLDELNGKNLIVAYWFKHEIENIRKRWPKIACISGGTPAKEFLKIMADWRANKIRLLAVQPSAMSHGVDGLQETCNDICWLTQTDQPEIRTQFEARIFRQGVKGDQVRIHTLLATGTIDVAIKRGLDKKDATQADVLQSIKDFRNDY